MTREELNFKCVEILDQAVRGGAGSAGVRLATLLRELTGKTPEPPKKTRGMEIAEKLLRQDEDNRWFFHPTTDDFPICFQNADSVARELRRYIADAIDAAEPQVGHLPVIEWQSDAVSGVPTYKVAGHPISREVAVAISTSAGFEYLRDYPNLKERK